MAKQKQQGDKKQKARPEDVLRRFFPMQMGGLGALKLFDIMEFSTATEERFVRLLGAMLVLLTLFAKEEGMSVQQAVSETAYRLGVSTATIKRYLQKYAVSIGPFKVEKRRVYLRQWAWDALGVAVSRARRTEDGLEAAQLVFRAMGRVVGFEDGEGGESDMISDTLN